MVLAYPLSYRQLKEMMQERGVSVDHATINRWVLKYSPQLEQAFHRRSARCGYSWRMDETYIKVKGQWHYLYRAVDKTGQTIDFLLTEHRDERAAMRFLTKAIRRHGVPKKITIDGSEANAAAIRRYNAEHGTAIIIRQVKYLNNIVEQDHRAVKRVTRPMLGFKSFDAAQSTLVGIELMHMLRKNQWSGKGSKRPHTSRTVLCPGCLTPTSTGLTIPSLKICDTTSFWLFEAVLRRGGSISLQPLSMASNRQSSTTQRLPPDPIYALIDKTSAGDHNGNPGVVGWIGFPLARKGKANSRVCPSRSVEVEYYAENIARLETV